MKSVEKCKRYSAFYPEKQELPHSLACVYWPVITSPRWRRVGTSQQRSEADNGASMYICLCSRPSAQFQLSILTHVILIGDRLVRICIELKVRQLLKGGVDGSLRVGRDFVSIHSQSEEHTSALQSHVNL